MKRKDLIMLARNMDFDIYDLCVINEVECVGKKINDSEDMIYWPLSREGSGFFRLFSGFSRMLLNEDWSPDPWIILPHLKVQSVKSFDASTSVCEVD